MAEEPKQQQDAEVKAPEEKKKASGDRHGSQLMGINIVGKIVGLIVIIWLISVSYWAFGFFALGMMPAILAMLFDRGVGRFASKTVSAFNFVGILPFLFEISQAFDRSITAQHMMLDLWVWLVVYGTASLGWVTIWLFPQVTLIIFTFRADMKMQKLKQEQETLIEEWGEEVKSGVKIKHVPVKKV